MITEVEDAKGASRSCLVLSGSLCHQISEHWTETQNAKKIDSFIYIRSSIQIKIPKSFECDCNFFIQCSGIDHSLKKIFITLQLRHHTRF